MDFLLFVLYFPENRWNNTNQIERLFNEDESIIQATIGRDSEQILGKKLPAYKEYINLQNIKI